VRFLQACCTLLRVAVWKRPELTEDFAMVRRILALGLVCGSLVCAQSAYAQGLWFGGVGFGGPGFYGSTFGSGFSPYGFGIAAPVAVRPVYVARPVIYGSVAPAYVPRPAVRVPLNRAYRRVWRGGW
jgi:hypothetical protein